MKTPNFDPAYPVSRLKEADYNPRKITPEAKAMLCESLKALGVIKPVILNGQKRILTAGHQRTGACRAVGIETVPAIFIREVERGDEINFNLVHNLSDGNACNAYIEISNATPLGGGFFCVDHSAVTYQNKKSDGRFKDVCRLIMRYGAWGSCVALPDGKVVADAEYAAACKCCGEPVVFYMLDPAKLPALKQYYFNEYGEYCFDNLHIESWHNTLAQKSRTMSSCRTTSTLYKRFVLPFLKPEQRAVDFGAGRCQYATALKAKGYDILAYEPHLRIWGKNAFNVLEIKKQVATLAYSVESKGLFDVVICDSVLNSVINSHFEDAVLTTLNALANENATVFVSTRERSFHEKCKGVSTAGGRYEYMTKDNFSLAHHGGLFTVQHMHTREGLTKLLLKYFDEVKIGRKETASSLQAICRKPRKLDTEKVRAAIDEEFNMVLPGGYRHNTQGRLVEAIMLRYEAR